MKPRRRGRFVRPGMIWAGVICHKIDQDPHSKLVRVGNEVLILAHRAHVIVDRIEIHRMITVIIRIGILPYRPQPDCRDAEVVQVLQVLPNAAQVSGDTPWDYFGRICRWTERVYRSLVPRRRNDRA